MMGCFYADINRPPLTGPTEADRRPLGFISGAIIAHESETLSFIKNKTLHLKHKGDGEGPGGKIHHGIVIITYRKKITGFESFLLRLLESPHRAEYQVFQT